MAGRGLAAIALGAGLAFALAACGGGGSDSSGGSKPAAAQPNTMTVTIDAGPSALASAGEASANVVFATVTVCTPGSTTACATVDHVQVDTGSNGLRVLASALAGAVPTQVTDAASGQPLLECAQFADGYSWGTVKTADVTLGPRTLSSLALHVIGDAAAGSAPSSCASGPAENDVVSFGANGVLGIGNFLQDCGAACAASAIDGTYYVCANAGVPSSCAPTIVALDRQVQNPVSQLSADANGIVLQMPAVASPGSGPVSGTLRFGVATQADNALGSATVYGLSGSGTFTTVSSGVTYAGSFIDSGSNGTFFASSAIPTCSGSAYFYCPASTLSLSGTIAGTNGADANVSFQVDNALQLFATDDVALPGLAGPNGSVVASAATGFDWGLPFFFGRSVYVVIEGNTVGGVAAPAIAF